jgi:ornithine carbamoyltransferase
MTVEVTSKITQYSNNRLLNYVQFNEYKVNDNVYVWNMLCLGHPFAMLAEQLCFTELKTKNKAYLWSFVGVRSLKLSKSVS